VTHCKLTHHYALERHSESTHLRQRSVDFSHSFRQLAALYIQRKFTLSGNGYDSFNPIPDPNADPDHYQNLITLIKSNHPENFSEIRS